MKIVSEQILTITFEQQECSEFLNMLDSAIDLANDYDLHGNLGEYLRNLKLAISNSD